MKIDIRTTSWWSEPASAGKPRVAVIGAGLSGATLAALLKTNCAVTVFERGGAAGEKPSNLRYSGHPIGLQPSFCYGLGGTTNLWTGGLIDMLPEEFGSAWPEDVRNAVMRHYPAAAGSIYGPAVGEAWLKRAPDRLGDNAAVTDIYYPLHPYRAGRSDSFAGCDLRQGHAVERIEEHGDVVELTVRDGEHVSVETFDFVVVAAGGVNSPVLLQQSGLGGDQVGWNYSNHPMGFVAKLARAGNKDLFEVLRARTHGMDCSKAVMKVRDKDTGLWTAFYLRPAVNLDFRTDPYARSFKFMGHTSFARKAVAALPHLREREFLYQVLENRLNIRLPSPYAYVLAITEQEQSGQGGVILDGDGVPRLNWRVSRKAVKALRRNLHTLSDLLDAELHTPAEGISGRLYSGAHHTGTCRISEDPRSGVVDSNLKLHGARRIYVCDGSVLPSSGASNTGLTITALARRLSEHLRLQLVQAEA